MIVFDCISIKLNIFVNGLRLLFPKHIRIKKKRYAYLVLENVGNFQSEYKDSIVILTHTAWAAIVASVFRVSYDLQVRAWHTVPRFVIFL